MLLPALHAYQISWQIYYEAFKKDSVSKLWDIDW